MQSKMATGAKGAALANLVTAGYLKGVFFVGKQYNKDGNWKLQFGGLLCDTELSQSLPEKAAHKMFYFILLARMWIPSPPP